MILIDILFKSVYIYFATEGKDAVDRLMRVDAAINAFSLSFGVLMIPVSSILWHTTTQRNVLSHNAFYDTLKLVCIYLVCYFVLKYLLRKRYLNQ